MMTASTDAFRLESVGRVFGPRNGPRFEALTDVSLSIPGNRLTTIVGPSGSGKSTLLSLLGLLDTPSRGELYVGGSPTFGASERERCVLRATMFGFVFQAFHLMARRTVLDNVALGGLYRGLPYAQRRAEALASLETVGLAEKAGNHAATLSGGEKQRVAIARALVGAPPILLCDEPTGNLDSANGRAILELLLRIAAAGSTVIVVTHDMSIADKGDYRISVRDGRAEPVGQSY